MTITHVPAAEPGNAGSPEPALDQDLELLTGPDVTSLLRAALQPSGGRLLSMRVTQVDPQPGRGCTAGYQVRVRWPDAGTSTERFAATTGDIPDGTLVLEDGSTRVGLWRFPHDPRLPGLPAACDPGAVGRLLDEFGYGSGPVQLRVRGYRPGRRAVIEATTSRARLFLKVVRPSRVQRVHQRHRLLTDAGVPAPPSLGYTPDGLLVLQALPGRTLRHILQHGGTNPPPARQILALLDRLPDELADGPPRASWPDQAIHYAAILAAALPDRAAQATDLAEQLAAQQVPGPVTAVHGDLYENQLLVTRGRITGLLDVDTAGPGPHPDDLACLLGHLSVLAHLDRPNAAAINRVGAAYLAQFEQRADPADLRRRTAAVVLSLATGPHRVQETGWPAATRKRLDLAAAWLDSARTLNRP
jgi:hypothetical protein